MAMLSTPLQPMRTSTDDLFAQRQLVDGKAAIVDGRLLQMSPAGNWQNDVAGENYAAFRSYVRRMRRGTAVTDNAPFRVELPHRQSFSPDAGCYVGPSARMEPFAGTPLFAVEVRSPGDVADAEPAVPGWTMAVNELLPEDWTAPVVTP